MRQWLGRSPIISVLMTEPITERRSIRAARLVEPISFSVTAIMLISLILISPVIYRVVLGRFVDGVTIPLRFIGKCFLASSPVLLLIPFLRFVGGIVELVVVSIVAAVIIVVSYKVAGVLGQEERDMLGTIPIPMADRLLKFMSS